MGRKSAESFVKRQKEIARKAKQQKKFEERLERRKQKGSGGAGPEVDWDAFGDDGSGLPAVKNSPDDADAAEGSDEDVPGDDQERGDGA